MRYSNKIRISLTLLLLWSGGLVSCGADSDKNHSSTSHSQKSNSGKLGPTINVIADNGNELESQLREIMNSPNLPENVVVQLPAGEFKLTESIKIHKPGVHLKGVGKGLLTIDDSLDIPEAPATVLDFSLQHDLAAGGSGAEGILIMADDVVIEGVAVLNTVGDGIKAGGVNNLVIKNTRVEWTGPIKESNGGYGLYPVNADQVKLLNCFVRGASDAGIYVGQSNNILVEGNLVVENVAGIEIENSTNAWVRNNVARQNTGGILVFDMPNIQVGTPDDPGIQGRNVKVTQNKIIENNTRNFAAPYNIVAITPPGTGVLIMANDEVEVSGNSIEGNKSMAVAIVSYYMVDPTVNDQLGLSTYDAVPESIYVHDNTYLDNGLEPQPSSSTEDIAEQVSELFNELGYKMPTILYDGIGESIAAEPFSPERRICVKEGPEVVVGELYSESPVTPMPVYDSKRLDCQHAPLTVDVNW